MHVHELAAHLGIPISTVYDWRVHGKGPTALQVWQIPQVRDLRRAGLDRPTAGAHQRAQAPVSAVS
jgi:hypothetical protein